MRRAPASLLPAALALALALAASSPAGAGAAPPPPPLQLGVATHFEQGWPIGWLARARAVDAAGIRDDVVWAKLERTPGRTDWSAFDLSYIDRACRQGPNGKGVLLVIVPRNPAYDGGGMVHSAEGRRAYAAFVSALLDRPGSRCVSGIEVGNEINAANALPLPAGVDPARAYVALLDALGAAIRPRHPRVAIVGGSTNMIGTGFLERLMRAGLLDKADAIAVHPYRSRPENVDLELRRLRAAMARHGGAKPVWASEFGDYFETPDRAAGHLLKMVLLMGAGGVTRADWYALVDEPWFPNTGLFDREQRLKPAGEAFRFARARILAGGAPERIDPARRRLFRFRLADGGTVLWGEPRPIRWAPGADVRDSRGRAIPPPAAVSDAPIVIAAATRFALEPGPVLADSFTEYGDAPWSYLAQAGGDPPVRLAMIDWEWTSFLSRPDLNPLAVTDASTLPIGSGARAVATIVRYTAPAAGAVRISACFTGKDAAYDVAITQAGRPLFGTVARGRLMIRTVRADLRAGDTLDFAVRRPAGFRPDPVRYRIRLLAPAATIPPDCLA